MTKRNRYGEPDIPVTKYYYGEAMVNQYGTIYGTKYWKLKAETFGDAVEEVRAIPGYENAGERHVMSEKEVDQIQEDRFGQVSDVWNQISFDTWPPENEEA